MLDAAVCDLEAVWTTPLAPIAIDTEAAATALGKIGAPVAIGSLVALLDDSYPQAARMVAWALGEIGDPAAIEPLEQATRAGDRTLARIAKEALSSLRAME